MYDPYLYDDCPVLRNKLEIKDADVLDKAKVEFSCNAIHDLLINLIPGDYDFVHLCKFYRFLYRIIKDSTMRGTNSN